MKSIGITNLGEKSVTLPSVDLNWNNVVNGTNNNENNVNETSHQNGGDAILVDFGVDENDGNNKFESNVNDLDQLLDGLGEIEDEVMTEVKDNGQLKSDSMFSSSNYFIKPVVVEGEEENVEEEEEDENAQIEKLVKSLVDLVVGDLEKPDELAADDTRHNVIPRNNEINGWY